MQQDSLPDNEEKEGQLDIPLSSPPLIPRGSSAVEEEPGNNPWPWVSLCLSIGAVSVMYRLLVNGHKEQTALLFIGIPLVLAILLSFTKRPKSSVGVILKGISLALLLSGVLLIEGFICILMAAPLFFGVGIIVGDLSDKSKKLQCATWVLLGIMSLEGVHENLSFQREEVVEIEKTVDASVEEVHAMLAAGPQFDLDGLPFFLQLGFPKPVSIDGNGLELGTEWRVHMAGGEGKPGDLVVRVVENSPSKIVFECVADHSHVSHWLDWHTVQWQLTDLGGGKTQVTMTLAYKRLLDPAWYFQPFERYGVKKAGEYFMEQTFS